MVSRFESAKDTVQELTESTATRVGNIAQIITGAVAGVVREVGSGVTDAIEMREAAKLAREDDERPSVVDVEYTEKRQD